MIILWSGFGFLPALFLIGFALCFNTNTHTGMAYAFFLAGLASGALGWYFHTRPGRTVIDKQTGREMVFRRRHTLFFIPMVYWGPIFIVVGLYFLLFGH